MKFLVGCENQHCEHFGKVREATVPQIGDGLWLGPRVICACGNDVLVAPRPLQRGGRLAGLNNPAPVVVYLGEKCVAVPQRPTEDDR